jgi:hypothetical protein
LEAKSRLLGQARHIFQVMGASKNCRRAQADVLIRFYLETSCLATASCASSSKCRYFATRRFRFAVTFSPIETCCKRRGGPEPRYFRTRPGFGRVMSMHGVLVSQLALVGNGQIRHGHRNFKLGTNWTKYQGHGQYHWKPRTERRLCFSALASFPRIACARQGSLGKGFSFANMA